MKLEVKIEVLKFCSAVFNTIFMVLGLSLAGCAVWILFGESNFLKVMSSEELQLVAAGLLLIGGVVVLVSVVGCVGASIENRFLLLVYLGFLIVLVLGQLFVMLVLLINREKIQQSLNAAVDGITLHYGDGKNLNDNLMDGVQRFGGCCGMEGPSDWLKNSYIQSLNLTSPVVLPCSCFSSFHRSPNSSWCSELHNFTAPKFGRGNGTFDEGCSVKISDWLQENFLTIVCMDIGLLLIQVLQFIIAVQFYKIFGLKAALKRTNGMVEPADPDPPLNDDLHYGEENYAYVDSDNGNFVEPHYLPYHPEDHHYQQGYQQPRHGY